MAQSIFDRIALGLTGGAQAQANFDLQQQRIDLQRQQQGIQQQQFSATQQQDARNQAVNMAMKVLQRAPTGSKARALAIVAMRDAGINDENLLEALQTVGPGAQKRETKVVGRSLVDIPQTGPVTELFRGEPSPTTQVNVNQGGSGFGSDLIEKELGNIFESGRGASGLTPRLKEAFNLLSDPQLNTGRIPSMVTGLQSLAEDLGVDLNAASGKLGIDLGDLATKEQFTRVTRELVLQNAEKIKGALNRKELELLERSTANPAFTEEANIDAVASAMAGAEIARERSRLATFVSTEAEARALVRARMSDNAENFLDLKEGFVQEMEQSRQSLLPPEEEQVELPPGAIIDRILRDGRRVYKTPDGKFFIEE